MSIERRELERGYFGILIPLGLLIFTLKIWRILLRAQIASGLEILELLRSDISFFLAVAIGGYLLVRNAGKWGRGLLLSFQCLGMGWTLLELIAHNFYRVTGSTFDLHLLVFGLRRPLETVKVVGSEVPLSYLALTAGVLLSIAVLPRLLIGGAGGVKTLGRAEAKKKYLSQRGLLGAMILCIFLSIPPAYNEDYTAFGRATPIAMLVSLVNLSHVYVADVEREIPAVEIVGEGDARDEQKNVVLVILESTRARSTSVYNQDLETTPFLAELAKKSLVAEQAYAVVPHTSKALVAILCGIEPELRMPISEAEPGGIISKCLPELVRGQGYRTLFMQSATESFEERPGLVSNMGFQDFVPLESMDATGFEKANYFGKEDAIMLGPSREWLEGVEEDVPVLAAYLTLTPHHDYLAPERFGRREFSADDELNRYLNSVYYVDHFIRLLMEQYREVGRYEDTIFVFVGDHGEAFGEHGRNQHDNVMWNEGLRVPLIIYEPANPESIRVEEPVTQLDLMPTLLTRLGFEMEGLETLPGEPLRAISAERALFAHCWYERRCMARIEGRYKFVDHFDRQENEIYDLQADPDERHNLIDEEAIDVKKWRGELHGWRYAINQLYRRHRTYSE